jgi:hypothetical protein
MAHTTQDPKKAAHRTMVVQEFVMTENNYKRDLQVLTDVRPISHLITAPPPLSSPQPLPCVQIAVLARAAGEVWIDSRNG